MQLFGVVPLALLLAATAAAAEPQLEVVSTAVNPDSHQITVTLVNHSGQTAVAYTLSIRQFDASGKQLGEPLVVGTDAVFWLQFANRPDFERLPSGMIWPGRAGGTQQHYGAMPETATASAQVLAVVYRDCTAEGAMKDVAMVFRGRAMHAEHARAAAELLATYPASPEEMQDRQGKLAATHEAEVDRLFKSGTPDRQHWSDTAEKEKALADLLTAQANEGNSR